MTDIIGDGLKAAAERTARENDAPPTRAQIVRARQQKTHERAVARRAAAGPKPPTKKQLQKAAAHTRKVEQRKKRHAKYKAKHQTV